MPSVTISFDCESSAQSKTPNFRAKLKGRIYELTNYLKLTNKSLAGGFGRGYDTRIGIELILRLFNQYDIKATWFCTGHVLLKENRNKNAYRINQILPYATEGGGFTGATTWRRTFNTFYHEPYSDYKNHPFYYLGDLTEKMKNAGHDIQCHTFSHPYISMENIENIMLDLNDWQESARTELQKKANIFAFPFLGDYHLVEKASSMKIIPNYKKSGIEYSTTYLPIDVLRIFKKNGFVLFTRCGSLQNEEIFHGFKKYRNSDIYFMKDKPILSFKSSDSFENFLNEIIDKDANVDLWLHPNDIVEKHSFEKFEAFVKVLINFRKNHKIHLCTLSEQWNNFKYNK